jgi:hypothetical protein
MVLPLRAVFDRPEERDVYDANTKLLPFLLGALVSALLLVFLVMLSTLLSALPTLLSALPTLLSALPTLLMSTTLMSARLTILLH